MEKKQDQILPEDLEGYTLAGSGNPLGCDGREILSKDAGALGQIPPPEFNSVVRYRILHGKTAGRVYLAPERRDPNRVALGVLHAKGEDFSEQQVGRLLNEVEFKNELDGIKKRVVADLISGKMPFVTNDPVSVRALKELREEVAQQKYKGPKGFFVRWVLLDTLNDADPKFRGTLCFQVASATFGRHGFESSVEKLLEERTGPMGVIEDHNDQLKARWLAVCKKYPVHGELPREAHNEVLLKIVDDSMASTGEFVIRVSSPDVSPYWFSNRGILEEHAENNGWETHQKIISEKDDKGIERNDVFFVIRKNDDDPQKGTQYYVDAHNANLAKVHLATRRKQEEYLEANPPDGFDRRENGVYAVKGMKSKEEMRPVEVSQVVPDLMDEIKKILDSVGASCTANE